MSTSTRDLYAALHRSIRVRNRYYRNLERVEADGDSRTVKYNRDLWRLHADKCLLLACYIPDAVYHLERAVYHV